MVTIMITMWEWYKYLGIWYYSHFQYFVTSFYNQISCDVHIDSKYDKIKSVETRLQLGYGKWAIILFSNPYSIV